MKVPSRGGYVLSHGHTYSCVENPQHADLGYISGHHESCFLLPVRAVRNGEVLDIIKVGTIYFGNNTQQQFSQLWCRLCRLSIGLSYTYLGHFDRCHVPGSTDCGIQKRAVRDCCPDLIVVRTDCCCCTSPPFPHRRGLHIAVQFSDHTTPVMCT